MTSDKDESSKHELIKQYKVLLKGYLEKRPSGLRRKISDAIGSNRSFVSQITSPAYRVPVPSHNVSTIMDVCHFSPVERAEFLAAYLKAHPGQADLLLERKLDHAKALTIDLSAVPNEDARRLIVQTLKAQAEALIKLSQTANEGD